MTTIKKNPDKQLVSDLVVKIRENGGYCPCSLIRNDDTKCMCKEFRETKEGMCHCGLFIKEITE